MSKAIGPEVHFRCTSDCEIGGCPGHVMQETFDRSSDVYVFAVDGKPEYYFDEDKLEALLKAHELGRELPAPPVPDQTNQDFKKE